MTGRTPNRMAVFKWGHPIRPQEVTLAEALQKAGYVTGHFGKWHLGSVRRGSPASPGANGFDQWISAPNFYDNDPIFSVQGKATSFEGESSMVTALASLAFIEKAVADKKPFLAVVWFGSPHGPHRAVEEDRAHYKELPERDQHYLGEVTGMDRAFGTLREKLDEYGIRENTILWYCSDNGALPKVGSTGGHRGNKSKVYEGGLLVPAILEWPARIVKPRVTTMRCITSDIYPTLLEIAGVKIEKQPVLDGISLLPLIEGKSEKRTKPLGFWDTTAPGISTPSAKWMLELLEAQQKGRDLMPNPSSLNAAKLPDPKHPTDSFPGHAAWIKGDWKLHRIQGKGAGNAKWELYNLAIDRGESQDVLAREPARTRKMQAGLERWLESVARSLNGEDY
jgi:arylsulfatase A-like enzyme